MMHFTIQYILQQRTLVEEPIKKMKSIHISVWIRLACVVWILVLTIIPVQTGWTGVESCLSLSIPVIAVVGGIMFALRKSKIVWSWIDIVVLSWYLYSIGRLWLDTTYPTAGYAVNATLMVMLYVVLRVLFTASRMNGNTIAILIILFSIAEAYIGYSQLISGTSRHNLYPVTGSFLNPGPYSVYLALGIILLCAIRQELRRDNRCLSLYENRKLVSILDSSSMIIIMAIAVPLILTMSRAAFLSLFICLMILYGNRIKGWKQCTILVIAVCVIGIFLYILKPGSANGRGLINQIGIYSMAKNPLFGSGIGSFFHSFAENTADLSRQNTGLNLTRVDSMDYAFNDLLLVGVEQGAVGLTFVVSLTALILFRLRQYCKPVFLGALSLFTICLFSYPFELLPYQIITTIIAAFSATLTGKNECPQPSIISLQRVIKDKCPCRSKFKCTAKLGLFSISTLICFFSTACYRNISIRKESEKVYNMMAGLHDKAFTKDYYSLLPYLQDNKRFLFDFAKILADQGRYNDSNDMLRRGALISNDPMFSILQSNNYRDMGAFDEAESMYLKAWHIMPNRIYPLYRLMKLHEQTENDIQCLEYAEKVISFTEKVQSPAVNDMKKEAQEIINRSQTKNQIKASDKNNSTNATKNRIG